MAVVVDASVALGWVLTAQAAPLTRAALVAVRSDHGIIPSHFALEVVRTLRGLERRGLTLTTEIDAGLADLLRLELVHDLRPSTGVMVRALGIAREQCIKVADAAYIDLALHRGLPLATRDAGLALAAQRAGVPLFLADPA